MASNSQPQQPPAPPPPPPQPQPPPPPGPGPGTGTGAGSGPAPGSGSAAAAGGGGSSGKAASGGGGGGGGGAGGAGDPQLVAMIVNHLKSQGLFDQFRRDCLADVDTKPAYQNLRQRVDNFVSNHLATHTWSPHLNKNQLRNNIRQQVLKSGMLESGIDRIISQVVDPKINHTFRPQVEKAVHEFLATLNHKEETSASTTPDDEKPDSSIIMQGVPTAAASANVANDAMSILETISSLNQEANAARASTETINPKTNERTSKRLLSQPSMDAGPDRERSTEDITDKDKCLSEPFFEGLETVSKSEDISDLPSPIEEIKNPMKDSNSLILPNKDFLQESSDQKTKLIDKGEKKSDNEKSERKKEKKEKIDKKYDHSKRNEDIQKAKDEKQMKEIECAKQPPSERNSNKLKTFDAAKEDSDVDGLTDITVSSVHTSDLSSFEEESEEDAVVSDSTEEGEITSDDEEREIKNKAKPQVSEPVEGKAKTVRHTYVHRPYLYSKYYSDSDDELTVEQRRQSVAREKEERLLRRQVNRERLEEKRKQKAAEKTKSSKTKSQGKSGMDLDESSGKNVESNKTTRIKEVLKERKVLEKKVALSKKRKKDTRHTDDNSKKKNSEEDPKEALKTNEYCEKVSSSKELKHVYAKSDPSKPVRRLSESLHSTDENKSELKIEKEQKRRTSTSFPVEGAQQDIDIRDAKRHLEKSEMNVEEIQKQKSTLKNEKHLKKDDSETQHLKTIPKKEVRSNKEKAEKEKTLSEDKLTTKHKYKGDIVHKTGDETELHASEKFLKGDENFQKQSQQPKISSDDKSDKKNKHKNERKISVFSKDGKTVSEYAIKTEETVRKENSKKDRHISAEKIKSEHKSRRSSDSKVQKDSQSSKQHNYTTQKKNESYSEEKCDMESTNSDGNLKTEDIVHKERRRTKSLVEDRFLLKSKSKNHNKPSKANETELQESVTKQATQKLEKEKILEDSDTDKQRKSKNDEKILEESSVESEFESTYASTHGSLKDSSHKIKLSLGERGLTKEKHKSDKDSNSRLERKLSEGQKSKSSKHVSKEIKKKEEKLEEKDGKEIENNHEKAKGNSLVMEKKLSRRLCENQRGSLSQESTKGEEKLSQDNIPSLQKPRKNGDDLLIPGQEPMEVDAEQICINVFEVSKTQDKSNISSGPGTESENIVKLKTSPLVPSDELRNIASDLKSVDSTFKSEHQSGSGSNSEKNIEHENILAKKISVPDLISKQNSEESESIQQDTHEVCLDPEISHGVLQNVPSENTDTQNSFTTITKPSEENVTPLLSSSNEGEPTFKHSINTNSSQSLVSTAVEPKKDSHILDRTSSAEERTVFECETINTSYKDHSTVLGTSLNMKEPETTELSSSNIEHGDSSFTSQAARENSAAIRNTKEIDQGTTLDSEQEKGTLCQDNLKIDMIINNEGVNTTEFVLTKVTVKENDDIVLDPSLEQDMNVVADTVKKEEYDADFVLEPPIEKDTRNVEGTENTSINTVFMRLEEAENMITDVEGRNENSEVGTSAGDNAFTPLHLRKETTKITTVGISKVEKVAIATSTEEKGETVTIDSVKIGDTTATSTGREESEVSVFCTSIEADEGFVTAVCTADNHVLIGAEANECTVVAAAEEGGGVTEGFAEIETLLTSTKEGESGECTDAEERDKDSGRAHTVEMEDNINSAETEEKDDAVTSAGSEEKCNGSSSRNSEVVEGTVTCINEVESDGAVTSAGTEVTEGSLSSQAIDEFQRSMTRTGPQKETEGTVTCTGLEGRSDNFIICSVTDAEAQEESIVTGAGVTVVNNDATAGVSISQEGEDSVNDGTEGESAVTSTGITEEGEGAASCTGSEDSSEGFPISSESEENGESTMDSTVAKEVTNITLIAVGPCDDEDIVTSTGAKEEDEEDEGVVTSTGRGNEIGNTLTCTGIEEEVEDALTCLSTEEGENLMICTVEHIEAEAGIVVINTDESGVDSMTSAQKEMKHGIIYSNAKEIVESSVTSAISEKADVTLIPMDTEECDGPMTSAATNNDSQLTSEEKDEDATISTGIVESDEVLVSEAVPEYEVEHILPASEKDDDLSSEGEDNKNQSISPGSENKSKGLSISTSTSEEFYIPLLSTVTEVNESHYNTARIKENDGIAIELEEFEAPMPSAVIEDQSKLPAAGKAEKDECAMISTSIVEEFDAPMSSATIENYEIQHPVATTEERNENIISLAAEDYEAPMSSATTELERQLASTSKDEKDECALISTSITEECEDPVSSEVVERENEHIPTIIEEKDGSALISTSSGEDCEGPVSSAVPENKDQPPASTVEEINDTSMISTSTTEECEVVMTSTAVPNENRLTPAIAEEINDGAIISTSTTEEYIVVVTSLNKQEVIQPAALGAEENESSSVVSPEKVRECELPMPSIVAESDESQSPRPNIKEKETSPVIPVNSIEEYEGSSNKELTQKEKNDSSFITVNIQDKSIHDGEREIGIGAATSSSVRNTSIIVAETTENSLMNESRHKEMSEEMTKESIVSICSSATVNVHAEKAEDVPDAKEVTEELSGILFEEVKHNDYLKTENPECINNLVSEIILSKAKISPCEQAPLLAPEWDNSITINSTHNPELIFEATVGKQNGHDGIKNSVKVEENLGITISSVENVNDTGNRETLPNVLEGLEQKTNLETETAVPSEEEKRQCISKVPDDLDGGESGIVEPQKIIPLENKSTNVENSNLETNEDIHRCKESKRKLSESTNEIKGDGPANEKDILEDVQSQTIEVKAQEEVEFPCKEDGNNIPRRKRKKHSSFSEDELDDSLDLCKEVVQSQCSEIKPQVIKEENSEGTEGICQESIKNTTTSRPVAEKGEQSGKEANEEKAEENEEDSVKSPEEDHPIVVKRKRGRPRKHPVEATVKIKEGTKTDTDTIQQSPPRDKVKIDRTDDSNKEIVNEEANLANDNGEEKMVAIMRRRGRKPKRSFTGSEEAETSEPEKKRQKSVMSDAVEDKKDQESEEEEDEDEDEKFSRATTRSATRLEAQRKQPSKPATRATSKLGSPETFSPGNRQKLAKEKLSTREKVSKSPPLGRSKAQLSPFAKRKREASPPVVRTRGQQKVEEVPGKKAKRSY